MAKSLRSKAKISARNHKRQNPNSDYSVVHAARLNHVASRLAAKNKGPKLPEEQQGQGHIQEEKDYYDEADTEMPVDGRIDTSDINSSNERKEKKTEGDEEGMLLPMPMVLLGLCDPEDFTFADRPRIQGGMGGDRQSSDTCDDAKARWNPGMLSWLLGESEQRTAVA